MAQSTPHIVCSSIVLVLILVQSTFLVRFAIHLEGGNQTLRPPPWIRCPKQILPFGTAMTGLAFCACNIALAAQANPNREHIARILLVCVVVLGEGTIVADLAYLGWAKYRPWTIGGALCIVVVTGIVSIVLRALAHQSRLYSALALWLPPAMSTVVELTLTAMQVKLLTGAQTQTFTGKTMAATTASRQINLLFYWTWVACSTLTIFVLPLQLLQILVLIQDPRYSPGPWMQKRRGHLKELALVRPSVLGSIWESGESRSNLVARNVEDA